MKKILALSLMSLSSVTFAASAIPAAYVVLGAAYMGGSSGDRVFTELSTSTGLTSSTILANPVAGLIVAADSEAYSLDLENEALLDEIEAIQISIDEGQELEDQQKAILAVGVQANQLDEMANILE
jgi:hypothetical protein